MNQALAVTKQYLQPDKNLTDVCLSFDGKRLIFIFANGEGYHIERKKLPGDDGSPITHIEIFDHGCAVAIHQASGGYYDLPWDSIKHYAKAKKQKPVKLGGKILNMRKEQGLSQAKLAKAANISRVQLSRIETNRCEPSLDSLMNIAKALRISVADLIN